jgi:hypothetical protein
MDPHGLLRSITDRLRMLAEAAVQDLVGQLPALGEEPSVVGTVLQGRLLSVHDRLPPGNSLVDLVREMLGDLDAGSPVRLHGWRRTPGALGVALVLTDPSGRAVLGVTPGGPIFDIVVTSGSTLAMPPRATGPWTAEATIVSSDGWDVAIGPGLQPSPPGGTVTIRCRRVGRLAAGLVDGPGISVNGIGLTVTATPAAVPTFELELTEVTAAILPRELASLLGLGGSTPMRGGSGPTTVTARADRLGGLRFAGSGTPRIGLPLQLNVPGVRTRGADLELALEGNQPRLVLSVSVAARVPGLPLHASVERTGIDLPLVVTAERLGIEPGRPTERLPEGIGTELDLPPVAGGGVVRRTANRGYAGLISIDLGVLRLQAVALFQPAPTSFLVLLAAKFPDPGIQLGLGFALDALGGIVGVNRSVDVAELQRLVADGHADRILFPDNAVERADEIVESLGAVFRATPGRMLVGPMVRITWGGRMVSLSGAVVLELPAPVRAVLVGRLLVCVPDPVAPLIRLQASVFGRVDPSVPVVELLVSLTGSWIVGLAVRGDIYLLVRGGSSPLFVLSAGGFHPRYARPPGVPVLRRLQIDLAPGGGFGLRMEAYFAITSNAAMFGGQVQLDATIAGCGVQGWLGLDALFVFEPVFAFAVQVRAGVAVRAFGRRLASVGLNFTLEGPAPWHAFGTGSISVLFWDVTLDFDVGWGSRPAVETPAGRDPLEPLRAAIGRSDAWVAERPTNERTALTFTPDAAEKLIGGELVHSDGRLRVSQLVVPLGTVITRFERRRVPAQQWTIETVTVGAPRPAAELDVLPERFVPGEFFDLAEDQQLTEPAFISRASGLRVGIDGARLGAGHRVEDGYETGYEPPRPARRPPGWPGHFGSEAVFAVSPAARLDRWRTPEATVRLRRPTLSVVAADNLEVLLPDVSLVNAAANAWDAVLEGLEDPQAPVLLVESWELSG